MPMASNPEISAAINEAEKIVKERSTVGFAWTPNGVDIKRYGIIDGLIKPALAGSTLPPIVGDASPAGREDYLDYISSRRNVKKF